MRANCTCSAKVPTLLGDERRLKQILFNLVKNAIKFTDIGRVLIRVAYYSDPLNILVLEVHDTGIGVAESDLPKLFTRFGKLMRTA